MTTVRKGEATSARMVEAMLRLIQSHGYAGTGLNTVLDTAAAPKGSLYFHFPQGKEQLGERAIERAATQFRDLVTDTTLDSSTPGEVVRRVIDVLAQLLADSDFQLGCPVSVVTLEMGAHSDRLRNACANAYESWIAPLARYLSSQGQPEPAARSLAVTVVSTVEGAMIISRANRDIEPLTDAAAVIGRLLDGLTTQSEGVRG